MNPKHYIITASGKAKLRLPESTTMQERTLPRLRSGALQNKPLTSVVEHFLHVPRGFRAGGPILVAVHGITRNAVEITRRFVPFADKYGCAVVSPHFSKIEFGDYQRLGLGKKGLGSRFPRADHALDELLSDLADRITVDARKIYMFGYSGGAQFVHRYAMAYPGKVAGIAAAAAGWYTLPDPTVDYPMGIKLQANCTDVHINLLDLLGVPALVLVGENDTERDRGLRTSARLDRRQGVHRVERGRRWIRLMTAAARNYGLHTPFDFQLMPRAGHSFAQCMDHGQLGERVFEFLFETIRCRSQRPGASTGRNRTLHRSQTR